MYLYSSIDIVFVGCRYHLCGALKFDEFPPGVTQVHIVIFLLTNPYEVNAILLA